MAKITVKLNIKFAQNLKDSTAQGLKAGIESMGLAFERQAKILTTEEDHVVTGRFRSSINLNSSDGLPRDTVPETKSGDGIHRFSEPTVLEVGSNVEYAESLEKRYGILARSMDMSKKQMQELFIKSFKKKAKWIQ